MRCQRHDNRTGLHPGCLTSSRYSTLSLCTLIGNSWQVAYYLPIRAKHPKERLINGFGSAKTAV